MSFKVTHILDGREVSEAVWEKEHARRQRRLKRAGVSDGIVDRRRDCNPRVGTALHDVMDAHDERYRRLYGEPPPPVVEDYRCEAAKRTWPGYRRVWTPQGWKEGPPRFKSYAEQETYERTYGFHQETGRKSERRS